jgi:hypothetical protein
MKITNIALICTLILYPLFAIITIKSSNLHQATQLEIQYNTAIEAAVQDGARLLLFNERQENEVTYESLKNVPLNKEQALDSFFRTLYLNFDVPEDPLAQQVLKSYLPVIAVVAYDGVYLYALDEFTDIDGMTEMRHVWHPKIPFSYVDAGGNSIAFTLDDYVYVYEPSVNRWSEGFREEIVETVHIPWLADPELFENVRRSTIVQTLQRELEHQINRHNTYVSRYGITYTFTLPLISEEDWQNTIDDVGIIAFLQGIPLGPYHYNNFAFGASRLVKKHVYHGTTLNGRKYYFRSDCPVPYPVQETFSSRKDAALAGYSPLKCN